MCFLASFFLSLLAIPDSHYESAALSEKVVIETKPPLPAEVPVVSDVPNKPEFEDFRVPGDEDSTEPYRYLLYDGTTFDECGGSISSMKNWVTILRRGNKYTLEKRQVRFGRRFHDSFGAYRSLEFTNSHDAVFMFNDTGDLRPGTVTTLPESAWKTTLKDGSSGFEYSASRGVRLRDQEYVFRRAIGTRGENRVPLSVLVMESEGVKQIIYYNSQEISPDLENFYWFGDFDGDGRLDFIFSYFEQNGGGQSLILFASSIAKKGELVRPYAFFHTCRH